MDLIYSEFMLENCIVVVITTYSIPIITDVRRYFGWTKSQRKSNSQTTIGLADGCGWSEKGGSDTQFKHTHLDH